MFAERHSPSAATKSSDKPELSRAPRHVLLALWWWDERLLAGIAGYGAQHGWIVDTRVRFANRLPIRRQYDGVIVFSGRDSALQRRACSIRGPIVNLDQHRSIPGAYTVCCNDIAVGRTAAEHLLACGLERILFLQMRARQSKSERSRFTGLRHACIEAGVKAKAVSVRDLKRRLSSIQMPIGIMAGNDEAAVEAIGICREAGKSVPDDVAIVGVDNFPIVCQHAPVPLSSVDLNLEQWGRLAAAALEDMMSGTRRSDDCQWIANGGVAARASTDVAHRLDPHLALAMRYIRENFRRPVKIRDLVRHVGVSRQSLQNYFRQQLNSTMHQQLTLTRLSFSMHLMRRGDGALGTIALASGFRDYQQFHRHFTRHTGLTPSTWRERHASGQSPPAALATATRMAV